MLRTLLLSCLLAACGGGGGSTPDAASDSATLDSARPDGAADASPDVAVDGTTDAAPDAVVDANVDAACVGERDAALCSSAGATCGSVTATDRCAVERTLSCGSCVSPEVCGVVTANRCDNADWALTTIDDDGDVGQQVSLVIDGADAPHVAYRRDRQLRYAVLGDGAWAVTTVDDPILGGDTAIGIDATGLVHIATPLGSTTPARAVDLWTLEAGGWAQTLIGGVSVTRVGIAFDGDDAQICGYHPRSGGFGGILTHYGEGPDGFDSALVDGTIGSSESREGDYCSIAFDGTDLHIAYHGGRFNRLEYATVTADGWTPEVVDAPASDTAGTYVSMALDPMGRPVVGYRALSIGDPEIRVARHDGADWTIHTVGAAGVIANHTSIAVDAAGLAHLSYFDSGEPGTIRYAQETSAGVFEVTTVAVVGTGSGGHSAIGLDSMGTVHIVYYDVDAGSLVHATPR